MGEGTVMDTTDVSTLTQRMQESGKENARLKAILDKNGIEYEPELKYTAYVCGWGYLMFVVGLLASFFLVFPLTFHFLGTYQVSSEVANMISLQSYMDTLIVLSLAMGIVFEMPLLSWLLGKMSILSSDMMRKYRRHSYVAILTIAAIITPTTDLFTLLVVSLPMAMLYEISILITGKHK